MRKFTVFLLLYAVAATIGLWHSARLFIDERTRHSRNIEALTDSITLYRTDLGESAASCRVLELRCSELKKLHTDALERLRQMDITIRRLQSLSTSTTATSLHTTIPLRDTILRHDTILWRDTQRIFRWSDPWTTIEGTILNDTIECRIHNIDTLRQIVHRIPRRFLFIRFGTKALRQEIISSNPHTKIVYTDYIAISRRDRRRR